MIPTDNPVRGGGHCFRIRSVLLWGLLNLALLGIGAGGVPLWAHHPFPRESIAFYELICGQVILASLLFPILAESPWAAAINLSIILPMGDLAGLLSNLDQIQILRGCGCVGLWMLGLSLWARCKSERAKLIVIALGGLFTTGGAILDYVRWENSAIGGDASAFTPLSFLPNLCGVARNPSILAWIEASIPAVMAAAWIMAGKFLKNSSTMLPTVV